MYCRILKGFQFTNEDKSFFAYDLHECVLAVVCLERISRTSTVAWRAARSDSSWPSSPGRVPVLGRVAEKGFVCICFVLYFSD